MHISRDSSFTPSWRAPVMAGVVVAAFVLSGGWLGLACGALAAMTIAMLHVRLYRQGGQHQLPLDNRHADIAMIC